MPRVAPEALPSILSGGDYGYGVESTIWFIVGVLALIVGLGISIGLHEWGHFYPAKRFGVGITKFMVGFGPTLWSKKPGETEFGIKAIPLGGYVAMHGMFAPSERGPSERGPSEKGPGENGPGERGPSANRPSESARRRGGAGTDFAGLDDHDGPDEFDDSRSFYRLSVFRRIVIMLGGPVMNLLIAAVLYAVLLMGFGVVQPSLTVGSVSQCVLPATETRTDCRPGDPAAPGNQAGMEPGDVILAVDGQDVDSWLVLTEIIRDHPGDTLSLTIDREGTTRDIRVTPLLTERFAMDSRGQVDVDANGDPVVEAVGFVGIGAALETARQPVTQVPVAIWDNVEGVTRVIVTLPQRMVQVSQAAFGEDERDPNGPISVVGVGRIAGEIASIDDIENHDRIAGFIGLLASLNIALFVFNLIPLLPLDGGHVAVALIDGIRRKAASIRGSPPPNPTNPQKLMPLTLVVVAALISMSVLLMYADIVNPISLIQ